MRNASEVSATPLNFNCSFDNSFLVRLTPGCISGKPAIVALGVNEIMLSDTTGESNPEKIKYLYPLLKNEFPEISLGLHLHSKPQETDAKLQAALEVGCTRFDTTLRGFGGCPMAKDEFTGNIATENLIALLSNNNMQHQLNMDAWNEALSYSWRVFNP